MVSTSELDDEAPAVGLLIMSVALIGWSYDEKFEVAHSCLNFPTWCSGGSGAHRKRLLRSVKIVIARH